MFTNLNLTDMETCYKVFKRTLLQSLPLQEKCFGFEPEVTAHLAKLPGVKIYEEGKKIGWKDGIRAIYYIIKYSFLTG